MAKAIRIVPLLAILSLVLLAIPFFPAHVAGAPLPSNVWVAPPPVGNDSNPGTEAQPFATIQKGIDTVELGIGGTVHVAAGTYHERGLRLSETMNLVGAGALTTIIDGGANGYVIEVSSAPSQRNTISGFTIRNGAPAGSDAGGGIYISASHIVTINDCAIINNSKGDGSGPFPTAGGGICNDGGALYMNRCTVSGNTATNRGGGIFTHRTSGDDSGLVELTNCTISDNTVTDDNGVGGGIYCGRTATMRLLNVTIANNQATGTGSVGGGFANGSPSSIYFKNCIVANNTAGDGINNNGFDDYGGAAVFSQGCNIDSENSCFFTAATDQRNTDPLLGPLQDNGGPTFTHALLHGSPAIDAGDNTGAPATDQRGTPRPQGTFCDIGAYELTQGSVTTATGTGTASFSTLNGYITGLTALNESALTCPPRTDLDFPNGLFSFKVTDITPGSSATVVIILPSDMPTDTQYWKCINGQWVDCTSLLGSNDGDSVLTLTITDGGLGDLDGVANGEISDPGGPAIPAPPTVTTVSPNSGVQGQTLDVTITGVNFTGATAVSFGAGITVNRFTVYSDTQITASITIAGDAILGTRDVSVTTPGGTGTLTGGFTVNPAASAEPRSSPTPPRTLSPSQMSLQYLSITPQQAGANQPITITTNVVNTGDESGNMSVALEINGQLEQSRMVSVGPHGTQPVKFTVTKAQPGTYNVDILGKRGSFTILGAGSSTSSPSKNSGLIALLIIGMLVLTTVVVLILVRHPA